MEKCEFRKVFEKIADNIYQRERYKHPTWHRSSQHMVRGIIEKYAKSTMNITVISTLSLILKTICPSSHI